MIEKTSPKTTRVPAVALLALALLVPLQSQGQEPVEPTQEPQDTVLVPVGPVQSDIYLAELSVLDGLHYIGALQNVTNRTYSYDDEPTFTPDSRSLLYTTEYGYGDRVQTDIRPSPCCLPAMCRRGRHPARKRCSASAESLHWRVRIHA